MLYLFNLCYVLHVLELLHVLYVVYMHGTLSVVLTTRMTYTCSETQIPIAAS
ncbi:hypothetical protein HMPREF3190_01290 [Umbribacter vaginalis]|nr:hypothetical protein HMPREF3190_01290 [Coriobacteriales bacterium DNF00809]